MLELFPEHTPSLHDSWLELEINLLLVRRLSLWSRQGVACLLIFYPAPFTKPSPCYYSVELFPKPRINRNQPSLDDSERLSIYGLRGGEAATENRINRIRHLMRLLSILSVCLSTRSAAERMHRQARSKSKSSAPCMALALRFVFDMILLILYCHPSKPPLRLCVRGAPP